MKLAKRIFLIAGVFGLLMTVPLVFAEKFMNVQQPEFYYGFVFLNICFQVVYLIISTSPVRFRPIMIPAFLAKASGAAALVWIYFAKSLSIPWIAIGAIDGVFAVLFLLGYLSMPKKHLE